MLGPPQQDATVGNVRMLTYGAYPGEKEGVELGYECRLEFINDMLISIYIEQDGC